MSRLQSIRYAVKEVGKACLYHDFDVPRSISAFSRQGFRQNDLQHHPRISPPPILPFLYLPVHLTHPPPQLPLSQQPPNPPTHLLVIAKAQPKLPTMALIPITPQCPPHLTRQRQQLLIIR